MKNNASFAYALLLVVGDFIAIMLAFTIAYILRVSISDEPFVEVPALTFTKIFAVITPFWLIIFSLLGLYNQTVYEKRFSELGRLLAGSFIGILLVIGYDFASDDPVLPARIVAVYGFAIGFLLLTLERQIMWQVRKRLFRYGWGVSRVMLIGSSDATQRLAGLLADTKTSGFDIAVIVGEKGLIPKDFQGKHYSRAEDALKDIAKNDITMIIQTKLYESENLNKQIYETAQENHLAYKFVPSEIELYGTQSSVDLFHGYPVISVHQTPLFGWGRIAKRIFDYWSAMLLIVILSPLLLLMGLLIKIIDPGPIFFRQKRVTRFGRTFKVYKFRTLPIKYNGKDPIWAFKDLGREDLIPEYKKMGQVKNDPRLSGIGRFMRRTSIDELPQLFNVVNGDISLVGPRAIIPEELKLYKEHSQMLLHVKTGITGLAQVSGRSDLDYDERIRLNLYYVQNWSFWLDLKILAKTVAVVLRGKGR